MFDALERGRADLIFFEAESYAPAPFALNAREQSFSHPDARVHIFCGGQRARNLSVLAALNFSDGTSLLEKIEKRGGHVLSQPDLKTMGSTGGNTDRYRKRVGTLEPSMVSEGVI